MQYVSYHFLVQFMRLEHHLHNTPTKNLIVDVHAHMHANLYTSTYGYYLYAYELCLCTPSRTLFT